MWYPLTFTISLLLFAISHGRVVWITFMQRLLIAAAFLQAVGDRLGLLGPPGTPGVAWGDFAHFIHYTAQVNSFMPLGIIPALAALATIAEILLGLTLMLGLWTSAAAIGSCILLVVFATAMTVSGLSQFAYSVYLMAAGALALATVEASWLSVDSLLMQRTRKTAGSNQ
jgi:putative oxidoreductase